MENEIPETTPWPDVLLDICSLGETDEAFDLTVPHSEGRLLK